MTTSQRLKLSFIETLEREKPDANISVVDAKARAVFELPLIAIDAVSVEPHSQALQHVERIGIAAVLRVHAGDNDDIDSWIDQIESTLTSELPDHRILRGSITINQPRT
jgi:hypothetical protein